MGGQECDETNNIGRVPKGLKWRNTRRDQDAQYRDCFNTKKARRQIARGHLMDVASRTAEGGNGRNSKI